MNPETIEFIELLIAHPELADILREILLGNG